MTSTIAAARGPFKMAGPGTLESKYLAYTRARTRPRTLRTTRAAFLRVLMLSVVYAGGVQRSNYNVYIQGLESTLLCAFHTSRIGRRASLTPGARTGNRAATQNGGSGRPGFHLQYAVGAHPHMGAASWLTSTQQSESQASESHRGSDRSPDRASPRGTEGPGSTWQRLSRIPRLRQNAM